MTIHASEVHPTPLIDQLRATRLPPPAERRALRLAVGAKLRHVAVELGVTEVAVSYWERGICDPGPRHLSNYLRVLNDFAVLARENSAPKTQT